MADAPPFRVLPRLDDDNTFFWTSGADGQLRFLRCKDDGYWIHPPLPACPVCGGHNIEPSVVSGRGVVHSFTINHQPWDGTPEPWSIVLVELAEQVGLRLTSNMVNCANDAVHVGMPVRVTFQQYDDTYIPVFEPAND